MLKHLSEVSYTSDEAKGFLIEGPPSIAMPDGNTPAKEFESKIQR